MPAIITPRSYGNGWRGRAAGIRLHFIPTYCPHLNPIERLWGLMHKNITHNRCYSAFADFRTSMLGFPRDTVPRNWRELCDSVRDNFRIISPDKFRVLT